MWEHPELPVCDQTSTLSEHQKSWKIPYFGEGFHLFLLSTSAERPDLLTKILCSANCFEAFEELVSARRRMLEVIGISDWAWMAGKSWSGGTCRKKIVLNSKRYIYIRHTHNILSTLCLNLKYIMCAVNLFRHWSAIPWLWIVATNFLRSKQQQIEGGKHQRARHLWGFRF